MTDLGLGTADSRFQRSGPNRIRGCLVVLVALAIIIGIGVFAYVKGVDAIKRWVDSTSAPDYPGRGHGAIVIQVKEGETASDIGATLEKADVVRSMQAFTDAAKEDDRSLLIQVGYYRMRLQMSGAAALMRLLDPESQITTGVTVPEGLRAKEILALVVSRTKFTAPKMATAFADTQALDLPSYANGDAEGYLYPSTYPVTPGTTPAGLLREMTARFEQTATQVELTKGAEALHMSPTDVVIVASLVQAEARRPQDMPKVARVIYNRLRDGMALQLDSTLHYAVDSRGVVQTTDQLRDLDTPYNSYTLTGLPPTPIDSPGQTALEAALHPVAGKWRYFVTVNLRTGDTRFAASYAEHQHNVAILREYCETSKAC